MHKEKPVLLPAKSGFTLVELIIVVIVIGILAAVGMPQYTKAIEKARGAEAFAGLQNIQSGEKLYFANSETYVASTPDSEGKMDSATQKLLDINLPQRGWKFSVATSGQVATGVFTAFFATGTRSSGACINKTMIFDSIGNLVDNGTGGNRKSEWDECQEGL